MGGDPGRVEVTDETPCGQDEFEDWNGTKKSVICRVEVTDETGFNSGCDRE